MTPTHPLPSAATRPERDASICWDAPLEALYRRIVSADGFLSQYREALQAAGNCCETGVTPCLKAPVALPVGQHWLWKLENQTATGAFKIRGALVAMHQAMSSLAPGQRHFFASSTGNHALAVLHAASLLGVDSVTLVLPETVVADKQAKLAGRVAALNNQTGQSAARMVLHGQTVEAAHAHAARLAETARQVTGGGVFVHPFADPAVVAGQGTIGLEMVRQLTDYLVAESLNPADFDELLVVSAIGGGGLLSGAATGVVGALRENPALEHLRPRFLGLQLASLNSRLGDAVRVAAPDGENLRRLDALGVVRMTMDDDAMAAGMQAVENGFNTWVEGPAGATVQAVLTGEPQNRPAARRLVISLLSGGNVDLSVLSGFIPVSQGAVAG
ncbi:MAG: pyridoxal-phosphate dependent enzyme [Candidatus Melainabacteria bacterium]